MVFLLQDSISRCLLLRGVKLKNYHNMKKSYLAPECDVITVSVECGLDNSFTIDGWEDGDTEYGDAE